LNKTNKKQHFPYGRCCFLVASFQSPATRIVTSVYSSKFTNFLNLTMQKIQNDKVSSMKTGIWHLVSGIWRLVAGDF